MGISGGKDRAGAAERSAAGAAYAPCSTQAAWDNHFAAFGARDLARIMLDYDDGSVVRVYTQETGAMRVYKGAAEIRGFFAGAFEALEGAGDVSVPVAPVVEDVRNFAAFGHVFLVWEAPGAGFDHVTDTFVLDPATHRILRQDVVVHQLAAQRVEEGSTQSCAGAPCAWDGHLAAFRAHDAGLAARGYEATAVINYYQHGAPAKKKAVTGAAGVELFYRRLFHNLRDRAGLSAPVVECEVLPGGVGHVFAVWRSPADGYAHVADTALISADGRIVRHNVAALKTLDTPAQSPKAADAP